MGATKKTKRKSRKTTATKSPGRKSNDDDQSTQWEHEGTVADRRMVPDRRALLSRKSNTSADTGLERRRGPGRRRSDLNRAAEEGELTGEQFLFLMAIDAFKRVNHVTYPTWSDVLEIVRRLGYRKVQSSEIQLPNCEDWTERPDAPLSANQQTPACDRDVDSEDGLEFLEDAA